MNLDFAMLADAATAVGHKLYIHGGGLRRIDAPQLPWVARLAAVARFTAEVDEAGDRHQLGLRLYSPADALLLDLGQVSIPIPAPHEVQVDWEEISIAYAIEGSAIFREEGWHRFELALDESPLTTLRLRIVLSPTVPVIEPVGEPDG